MTNETSSLQNDQNELQSIVEKLESDDINLSTAMDDYEKAIAIVKRIMSTLDKSNGRLQQLNNDVASILEDKS